MKFLVLVLGLMMAACATTRPTPVAERQLTPSESMTERVMESLIEALPGITSQWQADIPVISSSSVGEVFITREVTAGVATVRLADKDGKTLLVLAFLLNCSKEGCGVVRAFANGAFEDLPDTSEELEEVE